MDKKKSFLNVTVSIFFRVLIIIFAIMARRSLISHVGNEANGVYALFISIVGFLSIAELGVGSAITYCMYKPIVEGQNEKVSALYYLFKKLYFYIGLLILVGGVIIMPFLKYIAKDYDASSINLPITFGIVLCSVCLTYGFSANLSLLNAYKNNYIATAITSTGLIIQYIAQIIILNVINSFELFLLMQVFVTLPEWIISEIIVRKKYREIVSLKGKIDKDSKNEVVKNTKAMFMHKIGGVLVNTADSVIISAFISIVLLGKYNNYVTIIVAMDGLLGLFFSSLTSIVGHLYIEEGVEITHKYFNFFHMFNFILGCVFYLGYFAVIDDLVTICFGDGLILSKYTSIVITVNYFIQFMRRSTWLFREATGVFYKDRWRPIVEGVTNICLSILFVMIFPDEYKIVGVIVATIITNMTICHVIEPYVLYKYVFNDNPKGYYLRNYIYIAVFTAALFLLKSVMVSISNVWLEFLANGFIAVGIALAVILVTVLTNREFKHYAKQMINKIKNHRH